MSLQAQQPALLGALQPQTLRLRVPAFDSETQVHPTAHAGFWDHGVDGWGVAVEDVVEGCGFCVGGFGLG